jgi:hypothetical protein
MAAAITIVRAMAGYTQTAVTSCTRYTDSMAAAIKIVRVMEGYTQTAAISPQVKG